MKHEPQIEHLKSDAPFWKRPFRLSMPEWTPIKVSVVVFLFLALVLAVISIFPKQSTRDFTAASISTARFEFSNIELFAYEGLNTSIPRPQGGFSGGGSSSSGVRVTGDITNTTQNDLFLLLNPRATTVMPEHLASAPEQYLWQARLHTEIKGAIYAKTWDQVHGYLLAPNQKAKFHLASAGFQVDQDDAFDLGIEWESVDIETLESRNEIAVFSFRRSGSTPVWGEAKVHIRRPTAAYYPEIRVP